MTDNSNLKGELQAAQQLLFLVLNHVGEPVVLDIEESREAIRSDRMIDITLDEENQNWVLSVVDVPNDVS